jgi:hypothetical protein
LVIIDADDVMADFGETSAADQTDISRADDAKFHEV